MNTIELRRTRKAFGRVVRRIRGQTGLTQEELAFRSDLHRTYTADIERGTRNPSLHSLLKLANGLGVPLSKLFAELESGTKASSCGP